MKLNLSSLSSGFSALKNAASSMTKGVINSIQGTTKDMGDRIREALLPPQKRSLPFGIGGSTEQMEVLILPSAIGVEVASIAPDVVTEVPEKAPEAEAPAKDVSMNVPLKKDVASLFLSDSSQSNVDALTMQIDFESFAQEPKAPVTPSTQPDSVADEKSRDDFFATLNSRFEVFPAQDAEEADVPLPKDAKPSEPAAEPVKPLPEVQEDTSSTVDERMIDEIFEWNQELMDEMDAAPSVQRD